jgi:hypothetical protein
VVGRDAFRTGTGVHAAAVIKAAIARARTGSPIVSLLRRAGEASSAAARKIEVGPMSGEQRGVLAGGHQIKSRPSAWPRCSSERRAWTGC